MYIFSLSLKLFVVTSSKMALHEPHILASMQLCVLPSH